MRWRIETGMGVIAPLWHTIAFPASYIIYGNALATFRRKMIDFDQADRPLDIACSCLGIRFLPPRICTARGGKVYPMLAQPETGPSE